jgi:hypothetical protein
MKLFFTFLLMFLALGASGQDFKNSAGLRLGKTDGLTYKRFLTENGAVEFMLGFGGYDNGTQIYTTYQWHFQIPNDFTQNLYFYYGVGGHLGYIRPTTTRSYYENDSTIVTDTEKRIFYTIGIDGVVGLEYRIFTVPMTISMEVKPYIEYYDLRYIQSRFWDFGFTVKYIF